MNIPIKYFKESLEKNGSIASKAMSNVMNIARAHPRLALLVALGGGASLATTVLPTMIHPLNQIISETKKRKMMKDQNKILSNILVEQKKSTDIIAPDKSNLYIPPLA